MADMEGREAKRFRPQSTEEKKDGCIMEGRCPEQHAATVCLCFLAMPPQHRRALATRRGLCLLCLTHDKLTKCDGIREPVPKPKELWVAEHWLMSQQSGPGSPASFPARLPQYKHVEGRQVYQCRMPMHVQEGRGITKKTTIETLFDDKAERTVIHRKSALDWGLPSIRVTPTMVDVPGFGRQLCDQLFFIDAFRPKNKKADVPISAWGVPEVAKPSDGAPVPDLLRFRFKRPSKRPQTAFAQAPGVIELRVGQDYAKWFPVPIRGSMEGKDDLFFMRVGLSPYEIIYGEATVGLVAERRISSKKCEGRSRESSEASACREPSGGELSLRDKTVEENLLVLFGTSPSEDSSCSDKPSGSTHEKKKRKKAEKEKEKKERSPSRSGDRNMTMSEAEQQEQQPQPSTSKMSTLEAMAAKKAELEAKMAEMNRLVREQDRLMKLEQEKILKEQEDEKRRKQAAEKRRQRAEEEKKRRTEEEERRQRAMEKRKQEEKEQKEKLKREQDEKVRKQKEIADRRKAEEQEKIKVKEEKRLRLKKEQEEKKEKEKKEKAEEEQRQLQLKKDQEEKEGEEQQQLQQQQQEKKEQQQLQQQQQEKTKEAVQVEVTALCEELCRRKATLREHAIIRLPVGSGEVDEQTRYKVRKLRSPAGKAASVVPRLTEEMILLAPQDRSERALLGQLVMKGMLVRAPVGTKYGDEARDQAHFSFHKSKLPFKEKALQRVIQLHKAASLQQPAVPLQQPAVPLQQPAVPLQEPALPLQADPAADPAAGPAAEASQDPVQAEKIKASKEKK